MEPMMSDYKVETINDGMQDFYVEFNGPKDSLYRGGVWKIRVELPDAYPYKSPSVGFITKIYHPNVDELLGVLCSVRTSFYCIKQWIKVVSSKHSKPQCSVKCPLCFLAGVFDVPRFWKMKKFLQPNRWLEPWLRRELQALMQEEDVDIVLHHLIGVMASFCKRICGTEHRHKLGARTAEMNQEQFKEVMLRSSTYVHNGENRSVCGGATVFPCIRAEHRSL